MPKKVSNNVKTDEVMLSIADTAKLLGIGILSCRNAVRGGQLPSVRFGQRYRVPRAALDRWLEGTRPRRSRTAAA